MSVVKCFLLSWIGLALGGCGLPPSSTDQSPIFLLAPYVGQGNGLALVNGTQAIVFDAGPPEQGGLSEALRQAGVDTIAAIYLTHPDLDHWGGLDSLLQHFPVRTLVHGPVDPSREASTFHWACRQILSGCSTTWNGQSAVYWDDLRVDVLWPDSGQTFPDDNQGSLVLRTSRRGHGLLLVSGDLDTLGEQIVAPSLGSVEVVELGHHGSRSSGSLAFLGHASPRWVIVQAGVDNSYGHPTAEALGRARAVGAQILQPTPTKNVRLEFQPDE